MFIVDDLCVKACWFCGLTCSKLETMSYRFWGRDKQLSSGEYKLVACIVQA